MDLGHEYFLFRKLMLNTNSLWRGYTSTWDVFLPYEKSVKGVGKEDLG